MMRSLLFLSLLAISSFQLSAAVVADFTMDDSTGCAPLTVKFTDLSTGSPTSYSWAFGNGNSSALPNPSAVYNNPGVYSVTLTVSDGSSTDTKIKTITVYSNPIASYSVVPSPPCVGKPATFVDNSTPGSGPINSWSWDYGDGNNQTTTSGTSSHIYSPAGSYPSSLIVTDSNGCKSTALLTVTVAPAPVASFSANVTSSCTAPLSVSFASTSTVSGSASYSWSFGDGTGSTSQNPVHTYTTTGNYNVKLVVTQGACVDSVELTNYIVINRITADFTVDTTLACLGVPTQFTETSLPLSISRTWMFGDGATSTSNNPAYSYTATGVYTVTLLATDGSGCKDTLVKTNYITVDSLPVANFGADTTSSCSAPFVVTFADSSLRAAGWFWEFGDGDTSSMQNPVKTYTASGNYSVTLTVTSANGCTATLTRTNYISIQLPSADFAATPLEGCIPLLVNFTSSSASPSDPIANYQWTFGDGNTSSTANSTATNTYTAQGVYDVTLKITTSGGCMDSITKLSYIRCGVKPVANFSVAPTTFCYGETTQFTDLTDIANEWEWDFGDGNTSTQQNPNYLYGDTGTFTVQLIAKNNGCPDTIIQPNVIRVNPPIPRFTYTLSCSNYYTVNFTNTSADADSITWDFGDGTSDVTNNNTPTHVYATRGVKTVTLTAFNSTTGCSFFTTQTFTIAEPIASFTVNPDPAKGCVPLNVSFANTSQDANTSVWTFGNDSTSTLQSPSMVYVNKGVYTVTLTITDVNGCTDTQVQNNLVTALDIDLANFGASPVTGCVPLTVNFSDSTIADSLLTGFIWSWGDGSSDTTFAPNTSHTYTSSGFYTVTLTVQDTNACSRSVIKSNLINPTKPEPVLAVDTFACRDELISFDATGSSVSGPATYYWSFGDGSLDTTTAGSSTHSYSVDAVYAVTLTIVDKNGCDSTVVTNVRVLEPVALFSDSTLNYGCGTMQVKFTDSSTGFVNQWAWNFGNGAGSSLQNPSYTYTSPGTFSVTLVVTNIGGCTDTLVVDSIVVPGPVGTFSFSPDSGCVPLTVLFEASSTNADYFTWDFGDGTVLTKTQQKKVTHTYTQNISVTPILLIGDTLPNGQPCELPATNLTGAVVATNLMNVSVFPPSPISISEEDQIILDPLVTGNLTSQLSYVWAPDSGLSCVDCSNPVLSGVGQNMQYVIVVTDDGAGGCIGYDTVDVIYVPCEPDIAAPNVFTPNYDGFNDVFEVSGICISTDYELTIFDRWGVLVYSSKLRRAFWDGRNTAGEPMPSGTYYYLIKADDQVEKGFVHLMR